MRLEEPPHANGGAGGIRTHERGDTPLHDFQSCSFDQLGHRSSTAKIVAEGGTKCQEIQNFRFCFTINSLDGSCKTSIFTLIHGNLFQHE